jgi:glycolate oxidase FAD binding subunit
MYRAEAELLRAATEARRTVRPRGGGTKVHWAPGGDPDAWLSTERLDRIVEHNAGDLTAVLEAGVRLADAQRAFAQAGQMLALDPPLGEEEAATVGGIVATADSGPLRHRYGAARDLLLGVTAVLADGTVATSGGKVIKNVAGYDLPKLFAGSFGTLGLIARVVVRLHPQPARTATAVWRAGDPVVVARKASELAHAPLELESLDVWWEDGAGSVLARFGGVAALERARKTGADEIHEDDEGIWAAQRERQRSTAGVVLRVSGLPAELERVLRATIAAGGSLVGRAAVGTSWIRLADAADLRALRDELEPFPSVVLDGPPDVEGRLDLIAGELSKRVKARFDPVGTLT